jgi:hypothetical protein
MLHSNIKKININLDHCNMICRGKENIAIESTRATQNCMCQSVLQGTKLQSEAMPANSNSLVIA